MITGAKYYIADDAAEFSRDGRSGWYEVATIDGLRVTAMKRVEVALE